MASPRPAVRRLAAVTVTLLAACLAAPIADGLTGPRVAHAATNQLTLHAYDSAGQRLPWSAFRRLQENGKGAAGDNDTLVDPVTLQVVRMWPLASSGGAAGDPVIALPATRSSLAMAWPTSDGYSNLIIDLPATGGTYVFNLFAARQVVGDLDAAVAARPWYTPSADFSAASATAHDRLAAAKVAAAESQRGALGAQALDAAVHAQTLLLSEAGTQYARSHRGSLPPAQWGVTFDDISGGSSALATVSQLVQGSSVDGWVRIVFDRSEPAGYYAAEVTGAHQAGLHVLGQILDSSDMAAVSLSAWQTRVQSYVAALPSVDEWEIGNEVNGNWLGGSVAAKVAYAATYVKAHTSARTMLTLYWQLGEDNASDSMFTWAAANLAASTRAAVDDIGLSLYPEDHPMGAAFDRVMTTLHAAFPAQRLLVTELGYWSADLGHTWWWGSQSAPTTTGRLAVARLYQTAGLGYSYAGGGGYWWYYLTEALPTSTPLWGTLAALHSTVAN
ncbi:MAG: Tat pathway signal sequence [Actinomycetota bacterium]|nr:Tat pathway signal sequence [Actinomycetota bacterium]